MRAVARMIDQLHARLGRAVAWLALAMVLAELAVVLGRYVFGIGSIRLQESIVYMHALLFMLGAAYTLSVDGHVRVDLFYREAAPRRKALVNLVGALGFVIPVCVLVLVASWGYVGRSWAILERSRETSGLPLVFLLKTAIPVFAVTVALQGVSMAIRSLLALRGDPDELRALLPDGDARPESAS